MSFRIGHPFRWRFNAFVLRATEGMMDKKYGSWKRQLFQGLPDSVVELGPGTGANFRYYKRGTSLTVIEPNPKMHGRLCKNAEKYGLDLEILDLKAENISPALADESTDAVVATLLLCSVDQAVVLKEIHRILKPGGRFLFMEHVAAPKGTILRRLQSLFRLPWQWWFEGCNLTSETEPALIAAGFSTLELEHFESFGFPVKHYIVGVATK